MERVRLKVRRKEAVSSYKALLVETVKDPQVENFDHYGFSLGDSEMGMNQNISLGYVWKKSNFFFLNSFLNPYLVQLGDDMKCIRVIKEKMISYRIQCKVNFFISGKILKILLN